MSQQLYIPSPIIYSMDDLKVFNSLSNSVAVINKSGIIEFVNKEWKEYGSNRGAKTDSVGENYLELCVGTQAGELVQEKINAVINEEIEEFTMEYPCHGPLERDWYEVYCTKVAEHPEYVFIEHKNIRQQKIVESEVDRLHSFASSHTQYMNHEIKNKIAIVEGHLAEVEKIVSLSNPEVIDENIMPINRATDEILQILHNHRPESPLFSTANKRETELSEIGTKIRMFFQPKTNVNIKSNLNGEYVVDEIQLQYLLENLIINSFTYSELPVDIELGMTDSGTGFYVSDTGAGFEETGELSDIQNGLPAYGQGIGTRLISTIADNHGWSLVLENTQSGGRVVVEGLKTLNSV